MPQIPGVTFSAEPSGPVSVQHGAVAVPTTNLGASLDALGKSLTTMGSVLKDAYDDSTSAKAQADAQMQLQQFAFALRNGSVDEKGNPKAPPSPDQHMDLYGKEVERINKQYEGQLDGRALRMFQQNFTEFSNRQQLAVQSQANDALKEGVVVNLQGTMQQLANAYVNDYSGSNKPKLQTQMEDTLSDALGKGGITEKQAAAFRQKFHEDVEEGTFQRIYKSNPKDARDAIDKGEFRHLPVDKQMNMRSRAEEQMRLNDEREDRERRRLDADAEKKQSETEKKTGKDLVEQLSKGSLTPALVLANKANLSLPMFEKLLEYSDGRGERPSNRHILADLRLRVSRGEDTVGEIQNQFENGNLNVSDYKGLFNDWEAHSAGGQLSNNFETGRKYIEQSVIPDKDTATPADKIRAANVQLDWKKWTDAHPQAKRDEAEKEFKSLVNEARVVKLDQFRIAHLTPRYHPPDGDPTVDSIRNSIKATQKAFANKEIDEYERKRQLRLIDEYTQFLPAEEKQKASAGTK
jgi:hypothetical protein